MTWRWWQLWPRGVVFSGGPSVSRTLRRNFFIFGTNVQLDRRMSTLESGGQRSVWCPTTAPTCTLSCLSRSYIDFQKHDFYSLLFNSCVWMLTDTHRWSPDVCPALMSCWSYKKGLNRYDWQLRWEWPVVESFQPRIQTLRFLVPWICCQ